MANNKVQLANGTVLIDLTDTDTTAADVAHGKYFYAASGVKTSGTAGYSVVGEQLVLPAGFLSEIVEAGG